MKSSAMNARFGASKKELSVRAEGSSGGLCLENPRRFMAIEGESSFFMESGYESLAILSGNDPEGFQASMAEAFGGSTEKKAPTPRAHTAARNSMRCGL